MPPPFCADYPQNLISGNIRSFPTAACTEKYQPSFLARVAEALSRDYGLLSDSSSERLVSAANRLFGSSRKPQPLLQCESLALVNPHNDIPSSQSSTASGLPALLPSDSALSTFEREKMKLYSQFAFSWWRVSTLSHALSAMKAPPDLVAVRCPSDAPHRAGYHPNKHTVWVCGNLVHNPFEYRRLLAHELVHAFDFARAKIDVANPAHVACTETRAYNLSGECDLWVNWWSSLGDDMVDYKQRCIKEGVRKSMAQGPESRKDDGEHVDRVFRKCFDDHWPFTAKAHLDTSWRDPARSSVG